MDLIQQFLDIFLHLDKVLPVYVNQLGPWIYVVLFAIIFCELFAVGAVAALPDSRLSVPLLLLLLIGAAVLGDGVNYSIGYRVGPRVFTSERSRLFNKKHLLKTQHFYEKYGGKTIILARFIPIIRTFAPFVAGIGKMEYRRFGFYNVIGGAAWVMICLFSGYLLGNIDWVKRNFEVILVAIVIISVLPPVIEYLLSRRQAAVAEPVSAEANQ
jgi:membrane-associated protein